MVSEQSAQLRGGTEAWFACVSEAQRLQQDQQQAVSLVSEARRLVAAATARGLGGGTGVGGATPTGLPSGLEAAQLQAVLGEAVARIRGLQDEVAVTEEACAMALQEKLAAQQQRDEALRRGALQQEEVLSLREEASALATAKEQAEAQLAKAQQGGERLDGSRASAALASGGSGAEAVRLEGINRRLAQEVMAASQLAAGFQADMRGAAQQFATALAERDEARRAAEERAALARRLQDELDDARGLAAAAGAAQTAAQATSSVLQQRVGMLQDAQALARDQAQVRWSTPTPCRVAFLAAAALCLAAMPPSACWLCWAAPASRGRNLKKK